MFVNENYLYFSFVIGRYPSYIEILSTTLSSISPSSKMGMFKEDNLVCSQESIFFFSILFIQHKKIKIFNKKKIDQQNQFFVEIWRIEATLDGAWFFTEKERLGGMTN